jgi:hypothetical protein
LDGGGPRQYPKRQQPCGEDEEEEEDGEGGAGDKREEEGDSNLTEEEKEEEEEGSLYGFNGGSKCVKQRHQPVSPSNFALAARTVLSCTRLAKNFLKKYINDRLERAVFLLSMTFISIDSMYCTYVHIINYLETYNRSLSHSHALTHTCCCFVFAQTVEWVLAERVDL